MGQKLGDLAAATVNACSLSLSSPSCQGGWLQGQGQRLCLWLPRKCAPCPFPHVKDWQVEGDCGCPASEPQACFSSSVTCETGQERLSDIFSECESSLGRPSLTMQTPASINLLEQPLKRQQGVCGCENIQATTPKQNHQSQGPPVNI